VRSGAAHEVVAKPSSAHSVQDLKKRVHELEDEVNRILYCNKCPSNSAKWKFVSCINKLNELFSKGKSEDCMTSLQHQK